jgi:hypothetical protein
MSPSNDGSRRSAARKLALAPLLLTATAVATFPADAATSSTTAGDSGITGSLIVIDGGGNVQGDKKQAQADRKAAIEAANEMARAARAQADADRQAAMELARQQADAARKAAADAEARRQAEAQRQADIQAAKEQAEAARRQAEADRKAWIDAAKIAAKANTNNGLSQTVVFEGDSDGTGRKLG